MNKALDSVPDIADDEMHSESASDPERIAELELQVLQLSRERQAAYVTVEALRQRLIEKEMEVVNLMASILASQNHEGPPTQ